MDDVHGDALNRIIGDMDDMESKRMIPSQSGGATITISVMPNTGEEEVMMNKGGCVPDKEMSDGGIVEPPKMAETDDSDLPPFLRKKKGK